MRFLFFFFSFTSILIASCSDCSKKVNCPGFDDALLESWFPYKDNDSIRFASSTDTSSFHIQQTELTTPYETRTGGLSHGSGNCSAAKAFESTEGKISGIPNFRIRLNSYLSTNSQTPDRSVYLSLFATSINGYDLQENGFGRIDINGLPAKIEFSSSIKIGNKSFNNVQKASVDSNMNNGLIYQIYISKGSGIIAYAKYPSTELNLKD